MARLDVTAMCWNDFDQGNDVIWFLVFLYSAFKRNARAHSPAIRCSMWVHSHGPCTTPMHHTLCPPYPLTCCTHWPQEHTLHEAYFCHLMLYPPPAWLCLRISLNGEIKQYDDMYVYNVYINMYICILYIYTVYIYTYKCLYINMSI